MIRAGTLIALVGALIGFAIPMLGGPEYRSDATIVFTPVEKPPTASVARHVTERLPTWAEIVSSESVVAHEIAGTQSVRLEVTDSHPDGLAVRTTEVARGAVALVERVEAGLVSGIVATPGSAPIDMRLRWVGWGTGLGAVLGVLLAWLVGSLRRPGAWVAQLASGSSRTAGAQAFAADVDRELRVLAGSLRTRRGAFAVGLCVLAVAGYTVTGSVLLPFLALLGAFKGPRWAAVAILGLGVTVLPPRLELIKLGPVTPTLLEVAVVIGLVLVWRQPGKSVFTGPLILVTVAVGLGCVHGLLGGAELFAVADAARALLLVPLGFVVIYRAFAGRLAQLVAVVAVIAAVASTVELLASVAGWQRLLVDERTSVITGTDTAEVARLAAPVLSLWGPLLIVLLSGAFPTRPRWRLLLLAAPGVVHEAMSFNRSTWAPLLGCVVLVAVARFGSRGVVKRLLAIGVLGALGLALASGGAFGATGEALAGRASSVFSGQALGEDSLADRLRENTAAITTLLEHPVFGVGVGVPYGGEIVSYDALHDRTVVEPRPWIHNQYLRMWLWFGLFGLLAVGLLMVRVASVVVHSWRQRAPGTVLAVALGLGLLCVAAQSILQTTLIDRPSLLVVALVLAMLGLASGRRMMTG